MARGTTLGELIDQVRLESRLDPNPALSQSKVPSIIQMIRRTQERLYDDFDWPFLQISRDVPVQAGQRYYDVPDDMNLERIQRIHYKWSDIWRKVDRGICEDNYNAIDSEAGERQDPVQRWDVSDTGSGEQIELWPVPTVNGNLLRFTGIKKLPRLVGMSDVAVLDDQMIVLYVAAEMLGGAKNQEGQVKLSLANARTKKLQGRVVKTRDNSFSFAGGKREEDEARTPVVQYARAV